LLLLVKVCRLAYDISKPLKVFDRYSILEILTGDAFFVNLFCSILPVLPTECGVLIVCRQHNDKEWKFKDQHAKMLENIAGAKRYSRPRGFNIAGASPPRVSDASGALNTTSSHLPTKFSQPPNLHICITSSQFSLLTALALHLWSHLLVHPYHFVYR